MTNTHKIIKILFISLLLITTQTLMGEEKMELDKYYKSMYSGGTFTLSVGDEITFSSNESQSVKSKTYKIKLISIDNNFAQLEINDSSQRLERGYDYSYDLIRFIGIGYSDTKLVIAIGSAI